MTMVVVTEQSGPASRVMEMSTLDPSLAQRHFAQKLGLETDAWDLHEDLQNRVGELVVVDARSSDAYAADHIPGALSMPYRSISRESTKDLDKSKVFVTYCAGVHCNASTKAAAKLAALGFHVKELLDGIEGWTKEGFPLEGVSTRVRLGDLG